MVENNSVDIEKWLKLIRTDKVGPVTFARLIKRFGSVDAVLGVSVSELRRIEGVGLRTAETIAATRDKFDVDGELELADKLGVWMVHLEDKRYPAILKGIYDPPPVLYVKGTLARGDSLGIAIVGSRRCSIYGQEQASRFAYMLGSAGFTICSGMARGIDTCAHQGALSAGARTIAVQGCGLANIFPSENDKLFEMISKSGACISELPLQVEALKENFPPRNRIIAGLSLGTIVIEAAMRSGALITARMAMEYQRDVMAIPGKIDSPLSRGAHALIKDGAVLVESIDDITEALGHIGEQIQTHVSDAAKKAKIKIETPLFDVSKLNLNDAEKVLYDCLGAEPKHIEEIISELDLSPGQVNASLISLRLKGLIKQLPASLYLKK